MRKRSIEEYKLEIDEAFAARKSVVFLCGPAIGKSKQVGAKLRKRLLQELEAEGFEVVLGEDDGLEQLREKFAGYAHTNELDFINGHCNAVVLIAASVGSYCELGLFAFNHHQNLSNKVDFILLIDEKYKGKRSYLNEGPAAAIDDHGIVFYGDFSNFDTSRLIWRLKRRRSLFVSNTKNK